MRVELRRMDWVNESRTKESGMGNENRIKESELGEGE